MEGAAAPHLPHCGPAWRASSIRPPHGQRITGIQSAGRAIPCTQRDGVWTLHLEPRKEYTIAF